MRPGVHEEVVANVLAERLAFRRKVDELLVDLEIAARGLLGQEQDAIAPGTSPVAAAARALELLVERVTAPLVTTRADPRGRKEGRHG